jgi:asparagine synthase (glutamine-hydrolysing)
MAADEATTVELGATSVTYLGACLADEATRRHRCVSAVRRRRLTEITDLPGSFHVVVVSPEVVAVFGDAVGLRRVFYARSGDTWLVSDRADVLAERIAASLDDQWLALWLVWSPPEIASTRSPWTGVDAVPPGGCLVWRRGRPAPAIEIHWAPPAPDLPLADGVAAFAAALTTAVHGRLASASAPSLDLSGGKGTVALAFLAAAAGGARRLLAVTLPSISPDNDDIEWARSAAAELPSVEHLVVPAALCPLPYDDVPGERSGPPGHPPGGDDGWLATDHPSVATMHSARRRHLALRLREHGSGADHLAGYGGDEVLQAPPAYLAALLRRHPLRAVARLRRHAALAGTTVWPALGGVVVPGGYARWLGRAATGVSARRVGSRQAGGFGWGTIADPPPWLTDRTLALAAGALEQAVGSPALQGDVAGHATLARIQAGAATVRLHQQSMARLGVRLHCPYLDRAVVEASLAVRAHERTDPSAFKPLLDAALAATVPERFRDRRTKSHYSEDTAWGLWRNRGAVHRLVSGARLAERGLVDADVLAGMVGRSRDPSGALLALNDVLSCERWLRAREGAVAA